MKRIVTLLGATLFVTGVSAQETQGLVSTSADYQMLKTQQVGRMLLCAKEVASESAKQLIDSIIVKDADGSMTDKTYYTYDERGNYLTGASYWLCGNAWVGNWHNEYTYDDTDRNISYAYYGWDWANSEWTGKGGGKWERTFDEAGNITSYNNLAWNNGKWEGTGNRYIYQYDENNFQTGTDIYVWDSKAGDWSYSEHRKFTNIVDENGNLISKTESYLKDETWVEGWKEEFTYDKADRNTSYANYSKDSKGIWEGEKKWEKTFDEAGNMTCYIASVWSGNTWEGSSKSVLTYNADGNTLSETSYNWNGSKWIQTWMAEATYNEAGKQTSYVSYDWTNNAWVGNSKYEMSYDENDRQSGQISYYWNGTGWEGQYKWTVTRDTEGNVLEELDYSWRNGNWINSNKHEWNRENEGYYTDESYYWNSSKWTLVAATTYYYHNFITDIDEVKNGLKGLKGARKVVVDGKFFIIDAENRHFDLSGRWLK